MNNAKKMISERIKEEIERRGLTAYALGKMTKLNPGVIQRFLNGERGLTLATADKIADALGLELIARQPE
jgi:transcriptional regulator with XRE-family HTH domain